MIKFDQESCRDLNLALTREWLETNGIGGCGNEATSWSVRPALEA